MAKLSIITVNFNDAAGLARTLESVATQLCKDVELIIIDGGSTDGSVVVAENYKCVLVDTDIVVVSERDRGIYDGMNKGVQIATGEYCYFLNGGDVLADEHALERMLALLDGSDIVTGRVYYSYDGRRYGMSDIVREEDLSLFNMYLHGICHQAALIRRELLLKFPYDLTLKINADWKFFIESIVLNNASVTLSDVMFAEFDRSGISSRKPQQLIDERRLAFESIVPPRIARDYMSVAPHYYEVIRVQWLLTHPFWYRLYRGMTTMARKMYRK